MFSLGLICMLSLTALETDVATDEVLLFYPTTAIPLETGGWQVPLHGIVYEPASGNLKDQALLLLFRKFAGLTEEQAESKYFQERAKLFLADNERKREVFVRLGNETYAAGKSLPNGHFETTIKLTADEGEKLHQTADAQGWVTFAAVFQKNDKRHITGRVQFLANSGVSVISDLDDTIKVTGVTNRHEAIQNTFTKEFVAVDGMADVYRRWAEQGAAFHYVSASPWQLFLPLEKFRSDNKFPAGEWRMKHFRWKDSSLLELFGTQVEYKTNSIEPILKAYPKRQFVCVGDTGEQDPEIYGALARKHPDQIVKIVIRDISADGVPASRTAKAFAELPASKWHVFRQAAELKTLDLPRK